MLQYRNATYHGPIIKNVREGMGILIMDNGVLVITEWSQDKPNGLTLIWLDQNTYIIAQYQNGRFLDGYMDNGKELIYNINKSDFVKMQRKEAFLYNSKEIVKEISTTGLDFPEVIRALTGNSVQIVSLQTYLQMLRKSGKFRIERVLDSDIVLYKDSSSEKLGFQIQNGKLLSFGCYVDQLLEGFGCRFQRNQRLQGHFKEGLLHGLGVKISDDQDGFRYVFGAFVNGDIRQAHQVIDGQSDGVEYLLALKMKEHLKSTKFFNNFVNTNEIMEPLKTEDMREQPQETPKKSLPTTKTKESHNKPKLTPRENPPFQPPKPQQSLRQSKVLKQSKMTSFSIYSPSGTRKVELQIVTQDKPDGQKTPINNLTPLNDKNPQDQLKTVHDELQQNIREYETINKMLKATKEMKKRRR